MAEIRLCVCSDVESRGSGKIRNGDVVVGYSSGVWISPVAAGLDKSSNGDVVAGATSASIMLPLLHNQIKYILKSNIGSRVSRAMQAAGGPVAGCGQQGSCRP